ncbi:MAG: hypothetical protein J7L96_06345, partial [Bacteroidales bacterium]|nr:hypothetical protein [Bacteroidales bacterium]
MKQPSLFADTDYRIVPIRQEKSSTLTHAVYGYLPDWEYISARDNLRYDLITHISVFDFTVTANGDISKPSYWPWVDVINAAHKHGVKIIMTVVNFTSNQIHTLITSTSSQQKLFENFVKLLQDYDLQGVNIDFENVSSSD